MEQHLPQLALMKLPQFITTFALICNKTKLPQFVIDIYFCYRVLLFLLYNLCDLWWGFVIDRSCDHMLLKNILSPPSPGQWPPFLARCDLSRAGHNDRVTWLIYHVITLYSQKCTSPVSQRQWPLKLVGLWVRVKRLHLLFQVTFRPSDHVVFEKRHVSTNARSQNSARYI